MSQTVAIVGRVGIAVGAAVICIVVVALAWAVFWVPAQFLTDGWWLLWVTFVLLTAFWFIMQGAEDEGGW